MNAMGLSVDRIITCIVLLVFVPHTVAQEATPGGDQEVPVEVSTGAEASQQVTLEDEAAGAPSPAVSDADGARRRGIAVRIF